MSTPITDDDVPWPLRTLKEIVENKETVAARVASEISLPEGCRVLAITSNTIWLHNRRSSLLLYINVAAPSDPIPIQDHSEYESIVNAVAFEHTTLFYVTADEMIHVVSIGAPVPPPLIVEIPPTAIMRSLGIYFLRIVPLSPTTCIYSPTHTQYYLATFSPRPRTTDAYEQLHTIPPSICFSLDPGNTSLCLVDHAAIDTISTLDVASLTIHSAIAQLWVPPAEMYPPLAAQKASFHWKSVFSFISPSLGPAIVLLSATTILVHKRNPPFDTQDSLIAIIAMHHPIDILYRSDIDTIEIINWIGEVIRISCVALTSDADAPPIKLRCVFHLPAASMAFSMAFIPGSVFAFNHETMSYILFPQNSKQVNLIPNDQFTQNPLSN